MTFLILSIFIIGYLLIILEHNLRMNKAKSALLFGTLAWILIFIYSSTNGNIEHSNEMINNILLEIVHLSLFLIAAMTIISYLTERGALEQIAYKIIPKKIKKANLLLLIGIFTFFFSSIADNLTAALVSVTILLTLKNLTKQDIIIFIVFIIFAANTGGVALITGDVTTLMIFLAGKVSMINLLYLFISSIISLLVLYLLLRYKLNGNININKKQTKLEFIDKIIFGIFILTIVLIIVGHVLFHIPPSIIFLFGLSIIFIISWIFKQKTKVDYKILSHLHKVEFDAIFFFIGILLMVGSLDYFGLLSKIGKLYEYFSESIVTYIIGIIGSIFGNIPITATMLKADLPIGEIGWLEMTYAVGAGGSLLIIGSAAGIIAMSKYKEITFGKYLKFLPQIFIAYTIGYIATILITQLI